MQFDNKKFAAKSRLYRLVITLFFIGNVAALVYLEATDINSYNIYRILYASIILLAYIVFNVVRIKKKYNYIFLSDDFAKITIRFYPLVMIGRKYKAYEIPIDNFYKYEIIESGFVKQLILSQRKNGRVAQYPPISISALSENELNFMKNMLNQYTQA